MAIKVNRLKERIKEITPGMESAARDPGSQEPEFIQKLRGYMHEREIETPNELWRQLRDRGKRGESPSRATVHGYFRADKNTGEWQAPGRWFVRACMELLELDHKKCCELCKAYFYSYE